MCELHKCVLNCRSSAPAVLFRLDACAPSGWGEQEMLQLNFTGSLFYLLLASAGNARSIRTVAQDEFLSSKNVNGIALPFKINSFDTTQVNTIVMTAKIPRTLSSRRKGKALLCLSDGNQTLCAVGLRPPNKLARPLRYGHFLLGGGSSTIPVRSFQRLREAFIEIEPLFGRSDGPCRTVLTANPW